MIQSFDQLLQEVANKKRRTIAVAAAEDADTLGVVAQAEQSGIADFILIGDQNKIAVLLQKDGLQVRAPVRHEPDHKAAADLAVQLVSQGQAHTLMKGMLHSSLFLKALLNKEAGLNTGRHVTQISVLEKEEGGLLLITDCAISIAPDLKGKVEIIENAVALAHNLGISQPRVAVLAPLEVVNPDIPETVDAAVLSKMAQRGQIRGCIVDGPLAFDNAVSLEAAQAKGIQSEVAGRADIIVVPNLGVGNALTKSITYIAKKTVIAATVGAKVPVVFTSRTESSRGKLLTIALCVLGAGEE